MNGSFNPNFNASASGSGGGSGSRSPFIAPPLRKTSTGSFSKLSDFRLDGPVTPEEEEHELDGSGVKGVRFVELSVDARYVLSSAL